MIDLYPLTRVALSWIKAPRRLLIANKNDTFKEDLYLFKDSARNTKKRFQFRILDLIPCIREKTSHTDFDPHYVYHPAWAARVIAKIAPKVHVDLSSSLNFCTILSAFIPVEFYDYRPALLKLSNLSSRHADINRLPFDNESIESLSCMHVIEHIGLGRYGDPIDYDADMKAFSELTRVVKRGGNLLLVVPVGKPRIEYNAHRIYKATQIIESLPEFDLIEFSLIPDDKKKGLITDASFSESDKQHYACGCFWFKKRPEQFI
jgi:SAM-dependent methyltransferase